MVDRITTLLVECTYVGKALGVIEEYKVPPYHDKVRPASVPEVEMMKFVTDTAAFARHPEHQPSHSSFTRVETSENWMPGATS